MYLFSQTKRYIKTEKIAGNDSTLFVVINCECHESNKLFSTWEENMFVSIE
jgi:hypothetical protein